MTTTQLNKIINLVRGWNAEQAGEGGAYTIHHEHLDDWLRGLSMAPAAKRKVAK